MKSKKTMRQTKIGGKAAAPRKVTKRGSKFSERFCTMYGLKIGSRDAETSAVETAICRFGTTFGREAQSDAKRARTTNPKFFSSFRTDLFEKHLVGQQPAKWAEYCELSTDDERRAYFTSVPVPYGETLDSVFESEGVLVFAVNRAIVDKIVGGLLFHPDDVDGKSRAKALSSFATQGPQYKITIKRPSRFRLCVRFLGRGASFRMTANLMDDTREETGIGRYGGCSERVVAHYARVVCAVSLQTLANRLSATWVFSLALDCGTHLGKSYVDVRCRYYTNGSLENYHLLAIPLYDRHTALNIFAVVVELLDALVPRWRYQLLGVATDGAATMVGCVDGVATRLEKEAKHRIVRVWCGLHKLDLKMQLVFEQALNETYLTKLTALIGFLRRQQNLVADMQTTCPKVASTRWLSMYAVADWLCVNGFRVREYLSAKEAECSPNLVWWIFLFALRELACEANAVFVSLQGMTTLVKQQDDRFGGLVQRLLNISGALGPLDEAAILELDSGEYEIIGSFAISHAAAATYVNNLDLWVCEGFNTLAEGQQRLVVHAVARMYLLAISNIFALKEPADTSPRVTPKELVTSSMVDLASLIDTHRERILLTFGDEGIDKIGQEFKRLRVEYIDDKPIRKAIDSFDHRLARFDQMWQLDDAATRFPTLASLCVGFTSVFPNTATVEADFSLIGCEKTNRRTSLTDIALEGILHCKQWQRLSPLAS